MSAQGETAIRTTYVSIAGSMCLVVIKWTAGYFGNSYALIADAIESTTDVFSSLLVLIGLQYADRPADEDHPYGHGRAEPLVTFLVVGTLVAAAVLIAHHSIRNIGVPHPVPHAFTLVVLGAVIVWKEFSFRFVMRKSQETRSTSLAADAWHHRSDAITSIAAFIGISIAVVLGPGYEAADDWAALLASVFILYNAYRIFRPALGELMDEHLHEDVVTQVRAVASRVPGVAYTEKCYVRKAGMRYHVDLHASVDGSLSVSRGHEIAHILKDAIIQDNPQIADVLVHIEPSE